HLLQISLSFFFSWLPSPLRSTLFPYTTLFRSGRFSLGVAFLHFLLRALRTASRETDAFGFLEDLRLSASSSIFVFSQFAFTKSIDRKSTRLNSSHVSISYAVFCLKKKNNQIV